MEKTIITIERLSKKISESKKRKVFIIPEISEYVQGSALNKDFTPVKILMDKYCLMKIQ